ncbi:hypothetical protein ACFFF7_00790 [Novosphingobium aquiterrae]|uniref:Uncharacterized protein n=1 Tax=Novosphingobium aquiterrae TaxID=624388 RepID=A0ABV6PDP1_9SPHN
MAKPKNENSQFLLNFSGSYLESSNAADRRPAAYNGGQNRVRSFVDQRTIDARQEALRRVKANGIFEVPKDDGGS